jgi:hypothetical protein
MLTEQQLAAPAVGPTLSGLEGGLRLGRRTFQAESVEFDGDEFRHLAVSADRGATGAASIRGGALWAVGGRTG